MSTTAHHAAGEVRTSWEKIKPTGSDLRQAAVTSIPLAAAAVPDGMASAALVGVGPIHGLYGGFAGPLVGGLFASTRLMVVGTTSAASLAAYSALINVEMADRVPTMILITVLAGLAMIAAGYAGLGRFAAFVSQSVMTGFLTGVAVSIVLSQIPDLTGVSAEGANTVAKAIYVLTNPSLIDGPTLTIGLLAVALLVIGDRTSFGNYAPLAVLVVLSVVVGVVAWFDSVAIVRDVSEIDSGFPPLARFNLSLLSLDVVAGAISVAVIVMVQGSGVAQAFPNQSGERSNPNTDFTAQGWANVASGMIRGIPVGGSIGSTAMSVSMGARTRWVAVLSGVWMLAVLVSLSGLAEQVAMPTLAAILMAASLGSINPDMIGLVWRSGRSSQVVLLVTFLGTLFLPIGGAVALGFALSAIMYIAQQAADVELAQLRQLPDGGVSVEPPPTDLPSNSVTVLAVFGSLFFAGARKIENLLPRIGDAENPVVVLRLSGQSRLDATATIVLSRYAAELDAAGGHLVLTELPEDLAARLDPEMFGETDSITVIQATDRLDEATRKTVERIMDDGDSHSLPEGGLADRYVAPDPFARRVANLLLGDDDDRSPEEPKPR